MRADLGEVLACPEGSRLRAGVALARSALRAGGFTRRATVIAAGWLTIPIMYPDRYLATKKDAHKMALNLHFLGRKLLETRNGE